MKVGYNKELYLHTQYPLNNGTKLGKIKKKIQKDIQK